MHLVLQGHTKWLIYHLFHDKKFECYIGDQKNTINEILEMEELIIQQSFLVKEIPIAIRFVSKIKVTKKDAETLKYFMR
jgi:hypothetical protein